MDSVIQKLAPEEFPLCANIWNMERNRTMAEQFYCELLCQNRTTFVYKADGAFVGEISLVYDKQEPDFTIPGQRIYLSRLIVKNSFRRQGIGTALSRYVIQYAKESGFSEMSLGVDLGNFAALKLYSGLGFTRILLVDEDEQGRYLKLLKEL